MTCKLQPLGSNAYVKEYITTDKCLILFLLFSYLSFVPNKVNKYKYNFYSNVIYPSYNLL